MLVVCILLLMFGCGTSQTLDNSTKNQNSQWSPRVNELMNNMTIDEKRGEVTEVVVRNYK